MKPITGTESCGHAHVGFLVRGRIHMQFPDGCVQEFIAPAAVVIDPGHDGWVEGDEPAILIEFDFLGETAKRFGLPAAAPPLNPVVSFRRPVRVRCDTTGSPGCQSDGVRNTQHEG